MASRHKEGKDTMKKFKEFLENYDVYLDMPKKKKKENTEDVIEITSTEDTAQEEIAGKVLPGR
jgi:hypothetical protein